jgi:protocatechuate 3,4-dioxygenase beta subunit
MKRTILIAIIAVMAMSRFVVAGTITGAVTTESGGEPVVGVQVEVTDYETGQFCNSAITNAIGFYIISGLADGKYRIKVLTWNTDFVSEYYDNVLDSDDAVPVVVSENGVVQGINFKLVLGGTITGVVTDSNGTAITDLWVGAEDYYGHQYRGGTSTNSVGLYIIPRLPAGTYRVSVATQDTDFIGQWYNNALDYDQATPVVVPKAVVVQNINFSLEGGGLTVSGKVTDHATGLALANIRVTYWHDDFQRWNSDFTDIDGTYKLTGLLPGKVQIKVEPDSYYVCIGTEFELTEDIDNLDFSLFKRASLSGKVIDAETTQPLAGVEVTYWSDRYFIWKSDITGEDGRFTLTNLPPGIAELQARLDIYSGYSSGLPWDSSLIYLNEGEDSLNRIIALHKGALVSGYIKDPNGNSLSDFGCKYNGRLCEGESETDINGQYKIRLPIGTYALTAGEDDFRSLPQKITVIDINQPVNVPDIIAYSEHSGDQISGYVNNPGDYTKTGCFFIAAFEAGDVIDPNTLYTVQPISYVNLQETGPFTITKLPPGVNYDIVLFVASEASDETDSYTVRDFVPSVPAGKTGVNLYYNSQGGTLTGKVLDTANQPVLGASVLLADSSAGYFAGLAKVDEEGNYIMYNVPAGRYIATAVHSKYLNASKTVQLIDGEPVDITTIIMSFADE